MARDIIIKSPESTSALSINGKIYDLQAAPDYTDPLVVTQKNDLLQEIDLNELNDNLYLSVELLFVAYNGVAGAQNGKLQAEINEIMGSLALLCNKCVGTMTAFKSETQNIITELGQTYRFLIQGKEKLAIAKLRHCGESSKTMADKADELSREFMELQKRSVTVRSNTILEEASEYNKKQEAEKAIRDLEAKQKAEKVNQEELVAQVSQMQLLYDDAKSREEKAAEKSLILGVTSAIFGAIGAGLGAFAAAKNPMGTFMARATGDKTDKAELQKLELAQKTADDKKTKSDEANKKLLEVNDKITTAKSKLSTLKKDESELKTQIGIIEGVKEDTRTQAQKDELASLKTKLSEKTKEITDTNTELQKLDGEAKQVEKTSKDLTAEYGAAAIALQKLSESMDKMASAAASAEESIHAEKMKFLEKKFELEAEKRKSLVAMAEFAENIKNSKVEKGNADVSINSLHAAVEAMGKIIGTLTNASLFWKQMAEFCAKMSEKGFQSDLKDLIDPSIGLSVEERVEEYQGVDFMLSFLKYVCQWVALNGLSGEYLISASNAQKKCVQNIGQSPTIEAAKQNAPELAKAMGIMLNQKIQASTTASSSILQEQARLDTKEIAEKQILTPSN